MAQKRARSLSRVGRSVVNTSRPARPGRDKSGAPPLPVLPVVPLDVYRPGLELELVQAIAYARGQDHTLSRQFGVSVSTVSKIRRGKHAAQQCREDDEVLYRAWSMEGRTTCVGIATHQLARAEADARIFISEHGVSQVDIQQKKGVIWTRIDTLHAPA